VLPAGDPWLVWAERIDSLRVFPRLIITTIYAFFMYAWIYVVTWFMNFEWESITKDSVALALAAFPAAILGVLTQVVNSLTKAYWDSGRNWDSGRPPDDPTQ
jgi:hypothetical protein